MRRRLLGIAMGLALAAAPLRAAPIPVVAAESVYGDIARQIGGSAVSVVSVLSSPVQDPHAFEASPATARALADARLVIYNGAGYDPWVSKLLSASISAERRTIEVAQLTNKKAGDNPHIWYQPAAIPALARALAETLAAIDPGHGADYAARRAALERSLIPLDARIAALRARYGGAPVTATEPVFGYMAEALGLQMRNGRLQLAVMNDTEPSARDIAAFEQDLRTKAVRVLIFNSQTREALTDRLRQIAVDSGVPVVGVTETEPKGMAYQEWMLSQLNELDRALGGR